MAMVSGLDRIESINLFPFLLALVRCRLSGGGSREFAGMDFMNLGTFDAEHVHYPPRKVYCIPKLSDAVLP
jgi:hypothetical protein